MITPRCSTCGTPGVRAEDLVDDEGDPLYVVCTVCATLWEDHPGEAPSPQPRERSTDDGQLCADTRRS